MLTKIGTQKYHLFLAFMYWYDGAESKQLNLFEFGITPLFCFTVSLWPPSVYLGRKGYTVLWFTKGLRIALNKNLLRRANEL